MGSCAGVKQPERRYRTEGNLPPSPQKKRYQYSSPPIVNSATHQTAVNDAIKTYIQPPSPKQNSMTSSTKDPWKSRIGSRSVKKYERKPTLRQQQQDFKKINIFDEFQAKSIRGESLDESIYARQNMSPEQAKVKYENQFKQEFYEKGDEQIFFQNSIVKRKDSPPSPLPRRIKTQQYAAPTYEYEESLQKTKVKQAPYLPRKIDKMRNKQLAEIMQLVEKDAQTPSYVKDLRKEQGEDIKMNNFNKFEPVGSFQWFSLGKYLGQIQRVQGDQSIDKMDKFNREQNQSSSQIYSSMKKTQQKESKTVNRRPRKQFPPPLIIDQQPQIPAKQITLKVN